jgi:hypothetical protein
LDNHLPLTTEATTTTTTTKENLNVTIEIKEKKLKSIENEQIPKTLDLFTQDLNKQSSHSPSNALSSSSSSSCSSLSSSSSSCSFSKHNNNNNKNYTGRLPVSSKLANYKSTNLRILTSSVDKDLNKITTIAELPKSTVKTVPRAVTHGLPQSVRTSSSSIPSGIKTATTTTTTTNNKRKSMIKKSGLPVSPTSNINNLTIDIGDENKLVTGSKKTTTVDLFNDIEASNIIQPIQLHNAFAHTSIPKSFDMFANDINKQTSIQLPSSTSGPSSSSCSSLASSSSSSSSLSLGSSNRYSLNRPSGILPVGNNKLLEYKSKFKILTSSIDKDLNKITNNNNNKQEEIIKTKPSVKSTIPIARPNSSGIPVPKSFIPKPASISGVLRNSTNNNIAIIKVSE